MNASPIGYESQVIQGPFPEAATAKGGVPDMYKLLAGRNW